MKMQDLVSEVKAEIENENREQAKAILKERILEIQSMKKCLWVAEEQLNNILSKGIEDVV